MGLGNAGPSPYLQEIDRAAGTTNAPSEDTVAQRPDEKSPDLKMDPAMLYREDVFTDRKIGVIRRLTPVKTDGSDDPGRATLYAGETQIMTSVGPLPVNFEIEAASLGE